MPKTSPNYNVQLTTIKKQPYSNKVENENKKKTNINETAVRLLVKY